MTTLLRAKSLRHRSRRLRLLHGASSAASKESELQMSSSPAVSDGKLEIMSIVPVAKATVTAGANSTKFSLFFSESDSHIFHQIHKVAANSNVGASPRSNGRLCYD